MKDYICAIDIGSVLTRVVVARPEANGEIDILGVGTAPSLGVRTGSIVNIDQGIAAISEAAREAELMSGLMVEEALVNVTGRHLQGDNSRGVVAVTNRDRIVRESDVLRVIEGAQNIRMPADQEIIHVLSREFVVDDQDGVRDPVGMTGVRLEADVHIVTAGTMALSNLEKTVSGAGIRVSDGVMSSLAAAEAVLTPGEKDLGVAVADIGGGITDLLIYTEGGVSYSATIPLGGIHVTQDLSIGLKMPLESAEMIKKTRGAAIAAMVDPTEKIELPGMPGRPARRVLHQEIASIIEPRMKEILEHIDAELVKSGRKGQLAGGVVLTGGGSLIEGTRELAEDVFAAGTAVGGPTRITGFVDRVGGPEFAAAVGLLHYAGNIASVDRGVATRGREDGFMNKLKSWITENL